MKSTFKKQIFKIEYLEAFESVENAKNNNRDLDWTFDPLEQPQEPLNIYKICVYLFTHENNSVISCRFFLLRVKDFKFSNFMVMKIP